ncbi:MAG: dihydropteroate synthase [Eubacteriaceae bacterium]|jgi:dihydropteroate synthase|nr:dihydropteroate synthase [Eubacteriaceae bacterium]MDK2905006.1 dihydropteroate synthase [Eubacteriaceae bacterium]MDK2937311.1 dihydropteroate synthase [Eubacteriaceae bacterium]MDK2962328.1 dihydropteroate synthase [Eubacteriaceae bacterium]MDN5306761.1 dihydropteroate synthase [Eubacteriaceae bacterium]
MKIGNKDYNLNDQVLIMGILNVTPDSFSDGGKYNSLDQSLKHVEKMISDGVDIIDLGGESTRPGHTPVPADEELQRVVPMIEAIKARFDIPISIDTYKGQVGQMALKAGADLINDVWGFKRDPYLAEVTATYQVPCVLMHNRSDKPYTNFEEDFFSDLQESIDIAHQAGVSDDQIILDPGIGFAKSNEQNLYIMNHLEDMKKMGFPILLGTSRKRMIGNALNLPVDQRVEGTMATTVIGIQKGASIIRVHDVLENKRAAIMTKAILGG